MATHRTDTWWIHDDSGDGNDRGRMGDAGRERGRPDSGVSDDDLDFIYDDGDHHVDALDDDQPHHHHIVNDGRKWIVNCHDRWHDYDLDDETFTGTEAACYVNEHDLVLTAVVTNYVGDFIYPVVTGD